MPIAAILKIFDIVPGWVYALVIAGLLAGLGLEKMGWNEEVTSHAKTKSDFAEYKQKDEHRENERAQFALQETEKQRELDRFRNKAQTEATYALIAETTRTAAARGAAAERDRLLRDQIGTFASAGPAGGQGGGDTAALADARQRASTLGSLLAACRAEGRSDAAELEDLASQVRGLLTSYRSLASPPATAGSPGG